MIKHIITDFSKVLLFSKDKTYEGKLNDLHEELLKNGDYNFWKYFELNSELLEYYKKLSGSINVYIFTNKYIQEYPPVKEKINGIFKNIFIASDLEIRKAQMEAYQKLSEMIGAPPEEILFIDDRQEHVEAAKKAGMRAEVYADNKRIINTIESCF